MFSSNTEKIWKKSSSFNGKLNLYIAALKSVTETKPSPNESIFLNALLSPFQSEIICRNNKLVYGPFWIKVKGALGRTWLIPHIRQPWHKAKTLMGNRLCSHLENGALINYIGTKLSFKQGLFYPSKTRQKCALFPYGPFCELNFNLLEIYSHFLTDMTNKHTKSFSFSFASKFKLKNYPLETGIPSKLFGSNVKWTRGRLWCKGLQQHSSPGSEFYQQLYQQPLELVSRPTTPPTRERNKRNIA